MMKILFTIKTSDNASLLDEQRRIVAYLDGLQAKVNALPAHALGRLQSQSQEELDALLLSVLRPSGGAFKGQL